MKNEKIEVRESVTLEKWIAKAFEEKKENELVDSIKKLPVGLREKCRRIWKHETEKRKQGK